MRIYHATIGRESEWTVEPHMQRMLREPVREDLFRHHGGQASAVGYRDLVDGKQEAAAA